MIQHLRSRRLKRVVAVTLALAAGAGLAVTAQDAPASGVEWTDPSGHPQTVDRLHGDIVVLNFWATWCKPCIEELPLLSRVQRKYAVDGVRVIGVSADADATAREVLEFARARKVQFAVWLGATTEDMKALGLGEALPATAVLDREGRIVARFRGVLEKGDLEEVLDRVLAEEAVATAARDATDQGDGHDHDDGEHDHAEHDHDETESRASADAPRRRRTEASLVPS